MSASITDLSLLRLMHLVSPALPIGGYAYSQGLEYAIDAGWLKKEGQLEDWIDGLLRVGLANVDLPVLIRFYTAWKNHDTVEISRWNDLLRASRETKELLLEDEQLGIALQRLLVTLGVKQAAINLDAKPSFACQFALAGVHGAIECSTLMQGFAWLWLENQIAAATKIVPLGQTQAQKMLVRLMPGIPVSIAHALNLSDDAIGISLPGLALSSAKHERQYSRLFRS